MDEPSQAGALGSGHPLRLSHDDGCPECEERSCLRALICDFLYRNQILRFDLMWAQEQLLDLSPRQDANSAKGSG
jgi:hypothetical protein